MQRLLLLYFGTGCSLDPLYAPEPEGTDLAFMEFREMLVSLTQALQVVPWGFLSTIAKHSLGSFREEACSGLLRAGVGNNTSAASCIAQWRSPLIFLDYYYFIAKLCLSEFFYKFTE